MKIAIILDLSPNILLSLSKFGINAGTILKIGNAEIGPGTSTNKLEIVGTNNVISYVEFTQFGNTSPVHKIAASHDNMGGLESENAAFCVTGSNKFVFQHVCTISKQAGGNGNLLPNIIFANSTSNIAITTPIYFCSADFVNFIPHTF